MSFSLKDKLFSLIPSHAKYMEKKRQAAIDELEEEVIPNNYPVFPGYFYIADGEVVQSMVQGTIKTLRADILTTTGKKIKEFKKCDIVGRQKLNALNLK